MRIKLLLIICLGLTGCTIAINQNHTEGSASDLIDETQTNDPKIDPTISIPPIHYMYQHGVTKKRSHYSKGVICHDIEKYDDTNCRIEYVNAQQYPKRPRRDNSQSR